MKKYETLDNSMRNENRQEEKREEVQVGIWKESFEKDCKLLEQEFEMEKNYDVVFRKLRIGNRNAVMIFLNGFCKEDILQNLMSFWFSISPEKIPREEENFVLECLPYSEGTVQKDLKIIRNAVFSGETFLMVEGYQSAILIQAREYPKRNVQEPEKDKVLRGSKDGFVETISVNTALIRRRIRDAKLCVEHKVVGEISKTDVVVCYMEDRVDKILLQKIKERIDQIAVESLTMNQQSLAECLVPGRWMNPFPKFKYSERPDTTCAHLLEGNIVILVDNAPSAMILPVTIFDVMDEADDYYFPPLTGSYLRITRGIIALLTYLMTPTVLLLMENPKYVPESLSFILLQKETNIPMIAQFLLLELGIDGLKLAAVSTPNMLNTPLSIMAGLVLGEFSVNSGWFSSEVMLYMAFVAVANYTQSNYELGYALKFMRMITLITTHFFGIGGYLAGILFTFVCMIKNGTLSDRHYLYPLIPFRWKELKGQLIRRRLPGARQR